MSAISIPARLGIFSQNFSKNSFLNSPITQNE
jgi:hypothetical protein